MNDISDMNNLVQDVLDGVENPSKAMKVLKKEQTKAIDKLQLITACLEEIEGSDIEEAQRKVLKSRMSGYLYTVTEAVENLYEILRTTKETTLSNNIEGCVNALSNYTKEIKERLG